MGHEHDRPQVGLVLEDLPLKLLEALLLDLDRPAQFLKVSLVGLDSLIVLLAQTSLPLYLRKVGVQALPVPVAVEGVHSLPAHPLL